MNMLMKAIILAEKLHRGTPRKYTGEPYLVHVLDVASILSECTMPELVLCAGVLHDSLEDTPATHADLTRELSEPIADLVVEVTDVYQSRFFPKLNRVERKRRECERLAQTSFYAKSIKLADMISNTASIVQHDRGFALTYIPEMRMLLQVLQGGSQRLYHRATQVIYWADHDLHMET